jgi:non-specific serine/threonine protein kinase
MSILNPGLLGSKASFLRRFRKPIADGDETAIESLKMILDPFLLRRRKEQVAPELPAKEKFIVEVELSDVEMDFYKILKNKMRERVAAILASEEPFRAATAIITALTRLRQAAIAPVLEGGPDQSSKLDAVMEKLDEGVREGHKILVFSQYVRVLKILQERIEDYDWKYRYLDGSVSHTGRNQSIRDFQASDDVRLFLISLKAGGVGINLTAADYVFIIDPWWNPAVEEQAVDRTHRIGQTKPVFAYRFISNNTVEKQIVEMQDRKRELAQNIIGESASGFKSLTKEQIMELFA